MEPQDVLRRLDEIRAGTRERLAGLSQAQLDAHPPGAEGERQWSLGEVFMHLALDEIYLRELISRPLREKIVPPDGISYLPPPPPYGAARGSIEFWLARARSETEAYVTDWPAEWDPGLRFEGGLEPMNALEWLEGYGGHEKYHHRQLDSLIAWCAGAGVR